MADVLAPPSSALEAKIIRDPGEHLGLIFRQEGKLELVESLPDSVSARAGCDRYVGRLLTHVNSKPVQICADVRTQESVTEINLRFAWKPGEMLEVRRSDGSFTACAVRTVSAAGYFVAGTDPTRGLLFDKKVPLAEALSGWLRPAESAAAVYVAGQPVEVRRSGGGWVKCTVKGSDAGAGVFIVCGADCGRVFEKQVPFSRAATNLRPCAALDSVRLKDRKTKRDLVFSRHTAGVGMSYSVDGEARPVVSRIEYKTPPVDEPPGGSGGDLRFPDLGKGAALPQDVPTLNKLRILADSCGCSHNLPSSFRFAERSASSMASLQSTSASLPLVSSRPATTEQQDQVQKLAVEEQRAREGMEEREDAARRQLAKVLRYIFEPYGRAASVGMRCGAAPPLVVSDAPAGSPAAAGGLRKGDLVVGVVTPTGTWKVYCRDQLMTALSPSAHVFAGVTVTFLVVRGNATIADSWGRALSPHTNTMPEVSRPWDSALPSEVSGLEEPGQVTRMEVTCGESSSWRAQVTGMVREVCRYFPQDPGVNVPLLVEMKSDPAVMERVVRAAAEECGCGPSLTLEGFVKVHSVLCKRTGLLTSFASGLVADPQEPATVTADAKKRHFDPASQPVDDESIQDAFVELSAGNFVSPPSCSVEHAIPVLRELILERVYEAQEQGFA
eukprot:Hpha_TRINITY_DN7278_c0_g1::TRINITY_DN7278_c0_g1_i2::g.102147::m.102147